MSFLVSCSSPLDDCGILLLNPMCLCILPHDRAHHMEHLVLSLRFFPGDFLLDSLPARLAMDSSATSVGSFTASASWHESIIGVRHVLSPDVYCPRDYFLNASLRNEFFLFSSELEPGFDFTCSSAWGWLPGSSSNPQTPLDSTFLPQAACYSCLSRMLLFLSLHTTLPILL